MESKVKDTQTKVGKMTQKDLNKMTWRSLLLQASFNYERMQACGWLYSILPGLKKAHADSDEDLSIAMKDHLEFFNTHPFLVTFIMGLVVAMEENKEDRNTIRAIKVATMGPLGGIGDALFWLTALPIFAGLGASFAMEGNIAGPIIFLVGINILHFGLRFFLMNYGYKTGVSAITTLKEQTKKLSHGASILGLTVVGGLIASMVNLKTTLVVKAGAAEVILQEAIFDAIMPALLPALYTFFVYKLLKKGKSPVAIIFITIGIFVGLALLGDLLTKMTGLPISII